MAYESLTSPFILCAVLVYSAYSAYKRFTRQQVLPESLPWAGRHSGWFSKTRARLSTLTQGQNFLDHVYNEYSSKGKSCIYPSILGDGEVMVPPSEIKWLVDQPDDVLSIEKLLLVVLETDYTLLNPAVARNPIHVDVVKRDLTRQISSLIGDIIEELGIGIDDCCGLDMNDWNDVPVYESMLRIVARTSMRVLVGKPLCSNNEVIVNVVKYAQDVPLSAMVLRLFPEFMKPVIGPLVTLPNRLHYSRCSKHLVPVIQERINSIREKQQNPGSSFKEPNDFITWSIHASQKAPDLHERTADMISKRLLATAFAAIHTSAITITNVLFDLAAAPKGRGYLEGVREEVERMLAEEHGNWTKAGLAKLVRTDSALRESMRISGFVAKGPARQVVAPKGVTMNNGLYLPKGVHVGVASEPIHRDPNIYENANDYDAFRFSRPREAFISTKDTSSNEAKGVMPLASENDMVEALKHKNLSMVTTSETFVKFGHGRHACPGRFFAATELKLLVAYMVLNYDIKTLTERPQGQWFIENTLPPMKATISVRRRKLAPKV